MSITKGLWSQGQLLMTPITKRWSKELQESCARDEEKLVVANFDTRDEGRSRKVVAVCQTPEDAKFISLAPTMLKRLREVKAVVESGKELDLHHINELLDLIRLLENENE